MRSPIFKRRLKASGLLNALRLFTARAAILLVSYTAIFLPFTNTKSSKRSLGLNTVESVTKNIRGLRVAFVHEMIPIEDQGGNIRALRALEDLVNQRIDVDLYSRTASHLDQPLAPKSEVFRIASRTISLYQDDLALTIFKSRRDQYHVVITTMWFWRKFQSSLIRSIPFTVFESNRFEVQRHFSLTDDIHYKRCALTAPRQSQQVCADIQSEEEFLWQRDSITKIFVAKEDKAFVATQRFINSHTLHFLAWPLRRNPVVPSTSKCELAYYGVAHAANVLAVNAMLTGFSGRGGLGTASYCTLSIYGDDSWNNVIRKPVLSKLRRRGLEVKIIGKVSNLRHRLSAATLAVLPVTVGGTGVSSKVCTAIEFAIPFLSTPAGNRGLQCDDVCAQRFFSTEVESMLHEAVALASNSDELANHASLMRRLSDSNIVDSNVGRYLLEELRLSKLKRTLSSTDIEIFPPLRQKCKPCAKSQGNCISKCLLFSSGAHSPEISVYTALKGSQDEEVYMSSFVQNVLLQDVHVDWEWVVGCSNSKTIDLTSKIMRRNSGSIRSRLSVSLVLLREDTGLYETWDYLIQQHTAGQLLMNWNVDDRKRQGGIQMRYDKFTQLKDEVILVSAPVVVSDIPNLNWESARKKTVWFEQPGIYALSSFFQTDSNLRRKMASYNMPHNSPLYSRLAHERYGYFASDCFTEAPTCSDYRFWLRVANGSEWFYHLDQATDIYLIRADSHERRHEGVQCVVDTLRLVHNRYLINNEFHHRQLLGIYSRKILLVLDSEFNHEPMHELIKEVVDNLLLNAHTVDLMLSKSITNRHKWSAVLEDASGPNIDTISQITAGQNWHGNFHRSIPFVCYDVLIANELLTSELQLALTCSSGTFVSLPQVGSSRASAEFLEHVFRTLDVLA